MSPRVLAAVVFAALAGTAAGWALWSALGPAPDPAWSGAAAPDFSDERAAYERREREFLDTIETLRTEIAGLKAEREEPEVDPAAPAMAAPEEEAARTPEEVAAARAEALRDLESIEYQLTADPTNPDLLARLVMAANRAGEPDRAIETLKQLAGEHPDNPDVHSQLGRAYVMKIRTLDNQMEQGRYAFSAVGEFDRALEIDPDHFGARLNRGVTNYFMPSFLKKTDAAIADLEKLVAQGGRRGDDDRYAHAYAWLSRAYSKAGREEEAKKTAEEGLRLFPDDPNILRVVRPR